MNYESLHLFFFFLLSTTSDKKTSAARKSAHSHLTAVWCTVRFAVTAGDGCRTIDGWVLSENTKKPGEALKAVWAHCLHWATAGLKGVTSFITWLFLTACVSKSLNNVMIHCALLIPTGLLHRRARAFILRPATFNSNNPPAACLTAWKSS